MQRGYKVPARFPEPRTSLAGAERGYILLTLIFFVAVLAIGLTAILPSVIHEAERDREEEMVHRGAQYSRAIRLYYKKTQHYPAKIEDLESSNNLRFLRRRYKDPITGEDFKLLRFGEPGVSVQGSAGGGLVLPGQGQPAAGPGQTGLLNNAAQGILQQQQAGGLNATPQQNPSDPSQNPDAPVTAPGTPAADANGNPVAGAGANTGDSGSSGANGQDNSSKSSSGFGNQSFGGGAIVGVASTSKKETIREYNKKHHYNQWQFLYDPSLDRGGLITTPAQPQLQQGGQIPGAQGIPGQPGTPAQPGSQPNAQPGTPVAPEGGQTPPNGEPQQ
jgi:type II secretory pathway pseudopilin PulG